MSMKVSREKRGCASAHGRAARGQKIIDTGLGLIYHARAFETDFLNGIAPTLHSGGPPASFKRPVTRRQHLPPPAPASNPGQQEATHVRLSRPPFLTRARSARDRFLASLPIRLHHRRTDT